MNYKFVVNPTAARGKCAREAKHVEELCRAKNLDFDMVFTEKPGHAVEIARAATKEFKYVIAVGGDGTVHETVNGLMGSQSVFGLIPIGSGNDCLVAFSTQI